jgi:hypothetical protein
MTVFVVLLSLAIVAFVGLVTYSVLRSLRTAREEKRRFLEATAKRLKGSYTLGGTFEHDRINFEIAGCKAVVEIEPSGEDRSGKTTLRVRLNQPSPGTLHILQEGAVYEFLKLFGAQDISIGDPEFDRQYVVKAIPESLAAQVFAPDRRTRAVAAVRRISGWNDPTIELTRNQLRIQVRDELKSEGSVVTLAKTATEFLEFLRAPSTSSGIELGDVKISRDSSCPVCGTTLGSLAVRCDSCKTPHHAECWKYVGQCSTYACNGKRWSA